MTQNSRVPAIVGALAALVVGAAAGAVAERRLVRDQLVPRPKTSTPFGTLRGVSHDVIANDGTLIYAEVDTPADFDPVTMPTFVFSHGYALNHDTWHYQREVLRPMARLIFWDQRAHGRSQRGPTGSHHIDQLGKDLAAVVAQLAPVGPLVLVGHSMGGMTVMSMAADFPELFAARVIGVALLGTSAGGLNDVLLGLPVVIARLAHEFVPVVAPTLIQQRDVIEFSRQRSNDLTKLLTRRYSFASPVSPEVANFAFGMINATPIDVVGEFLPTFDQHDKRAALATMSGIETLVMVGTKDAMTPVEHSYEIIRRVPHAELVLLADTGHMLMLERPAEVNEELVALLQRAWRAWEDESE